MLDFRQDLWNLREQNSRKLWCVAELLVWALLPYGQFCVPHVLMDISVSDFFFCRLKIAVVIMTL